MKQNVGLIVMGVSGSGKTTIGRMLAEEIGAEFLDADDFHPPENVQKMSEGLPLTDEDRFPWLDTLREEMALRIDHDERVVLACSALKHTYRERISKDVPIEFIYLKGSFDVIEGRLIERKEHFMQSSLLESQFETLEEPDLREALFVSINQAPEEIVRIIVSSLDD